MTFTYSFACPFCHGSWQFEQFARIAKDVFDSFEGVGECPLCRGTFEWVGPGEITGEMNGKKWYELKQPKHYKPHPCEWCGRQLEGKRRFCNVQCNKKFYYRKSHPEVQRRTPIISLGTENKE